MKSVVSLPLNFPTSTIVHELLPFSCCTKKKNRTHGTSSMASSSSSSLSMELDESTESRIERLISENPVIIFTKSSSPCCMCHVMKNLLSTIGVHPTVIKLDDHEITAALHNNTTTPAAFIGGTCIGGLESLVALHVTGLLVPKLHQVGALCHL
ncbi:glutaredoxin-C6-like [Lotus japonicus]|uniref:glutaredoxin-C6-like n=1 Tax=Lotus japonicus TaxID=34305 RepID=UPI0025902A53|nr:glutaredoxin-C6-like [Lotus japonicus]